MLDKLLGESIEKNMLFEKLFGLLGYPKALSPQHFIIVCFALRFWHVNTIEWVSSTKAQCSKETEEQHIHSSSLTPVFTNVHFGPYRFTSTCCINVLFQ